MSWFIIHMDIHRSHTDFGDMNLFRLGSPALDAAMNEESVVNMSHLCVQTRVKSRLSLVS